RLDLVDEPLRGIGRIDVAEDRVAAALAHGGRHDDVAALAFDRDTLRHLSWAAADRLLVLQFEDYVRPAGSGAVLARLERLMLGDERIPGGDALVFVFQGGVDVGAPHIGARPHRHRDQRVRIFFPPARDDNGIAGRFLKTASAGNAFLELAGWIGITSWDRDLGHGVAGKDWDAMLGVDQRGVEHATGLGIDFDGLAYRRSKAGTARDTERNPFCWERDDVGCRWPLGLGLLKRVPFEFWAIIAVGFGRVIFCRCGEGDQLFYVVVRKIENAQPTRDWGEPLCD